jgi:hypothetical protein
VLRSTDAMLDSFRETMQKRTGRSVEHWLDVAGETGDVAGRIRMLQREHGLGRADAAALGMFGNTR